MKIEEEILKDKIAALSSQVKDLESRLQEAHNIFNIHSLPIIITNFNNQVRLANEQALKLFSARTEQVYSFNFLKQVLSEPELKQWNLYKAKLQASKRVTFEIKIKAQNSPAFTLEVISIKLQFQGEQCVLSYLRDVTDQKMAEMNYVREHKLHQLILDAIPAMVFIKDTESRIISINKTFEEITGLNKSEVIGKRLMELTSNQNTIEKYWRDDLEVIETGVAKRNIIEPLFTDPGRWFITDKIPYLSDTGKTNGIIGFSMDITERKHAEEALIRSEKKFRLLFNTAPDGIMVGNLEGDFYTANKTYLDMLGYTMPELLNLKYHNIIPEKWIELIEATIADIQQKGLSSFVMEIELCKKDRSVIPVLMSVWIMLNENNIPYQLGAYIKDLTDTKKAEHLEKELLRKDREQLEKDLEAKTRELNTRVTQLIETNELVNGVIEKLKDVTQIEEEYKNRQIQFIINDLEKHGNEDLWQQFEITFGQVHPSFYNDLYEIYPNLTPNERKLCAFLKMNLSTKDISSITHQTIRSIEIARFRLRTKMKLSRSTNLPKFLSGF